MLLVTLLWGLFHAIRAHWLAATGKAVNLHVEKGQPSMSWLFASYGATTALFSLAVTLAEAAKGYSVILIVGDYVALSYLFFFNTWFRHQIVFRMLLRISAH